MTYLFIIIIASLISFIVFEKNFKQLLFSKKNIFSLIIFYSITFVGVGASAPLQENKKQISKQGYEK